MLPKNIKINVYRMPVKKIFLAGDRMRVNRKHYKVEVARVPVETKAEEDALQQQAARLYTQAVPMHVVFTPTGAYIVSPATTM